MASFPFFRISSRRSFLKEKSMKKKKTPLFPSFAVFALCCAGVLPAEAQSVIPVPAEMKLTEGAFAVAPGVAVFCNLQGVERERTTLPPPAFCC